MKDYAFVFDPKDYPNTKFNELHKLPINTFNRLKSAVSRFNEVKRPDGSPVSKEEKDTAWGKISRAAEQINFPLESNWEELMLLEELKKSTNNSFVTGVITRTSVKTKNNIKTYLLECIVSSDIQDSYSTTLTKSCLESLAQQINARSENYPVKFQTTHDNTWTNAIGKVTSAEVIYDGFISQLKITAELDNAHPFTPYLIKHAEKQINKDFKEPYVFIGFSIFGFIKEAYYTDVNQQKIYLTREEFTDLESFVEITVEDIYLDHIAITSTPSNLETEITDVIKRSVPSNPKSKLDETSSWSFSASDGNKIIEKGGYTLYAKCHAYKDDNKDPETKEAYKLPHHKLDEQGNMTLYWHGVRAAMSALLGSRGGVEVPDKDKEKIFKHLSAHYKQFNKKIPEFKRNGEQIMKKNQIEAAETSAQKSTSEDVEQKQKEVVKQQKEDVKQTSEKEDVKQTSEKEVVKQASEKEDVKQASEKEDVKQTSEKEVEQQTEAQKTVVEVKLDSADIQSSMNSLQDSVKELIEKVETQVAETQVTKTQVAEKEVEKQTVGLLSREAVNELIDKKLSEQLKDINLIRKNIQLLNESVRKIADCLNKKIEDQTKFDVTSGQVKREAISPLDLIAQNYVKKFTQ